MQYEKSVIVGVGFKDLQASHASRHLFAEIILIDKTHEALNPLVYQLKKDVLPTDGDLLAASRGLPVQPDAFMMMGEVVSIDKKKKLIYLSNNDTVSYNHLIVASGNKQSLSNLDQEKEFSDGLQTLIDALRVRQLPTTFGLQNPLPLINSKAKVQSSRFATFDHSEPSISKEIQRIVTHHILQEKGKTFSLSLNGTEKRLYEVVV